MHNVLYHDTVSVQPPLSTTLSGLPHWLQGETTKASRGVTAKVTVMTCDVRRVRRFPDVVCLETWPPDTADLRTLRVGGVGFQLHHIRSKTHSGVGWGRADIVHIFVHMARIKWTSRRAVTDVELCGRF
ncbi:hypothetical protein RRG08_038644 [Elysia crispata]|uniref:Uncharacterized protein n=1 Tax=Elysia crispata TaxID=231223 RepID=A0AAE1D0I8_9GAST|nr:hypothetical protein RRG08_038644 [Elysia crispata]